MDNTQVQLGGSAVLGPTLNSGHYPSIAFGAAEGLCRHQVSPLFAPPVPRKQPTRYVYGVIIAVWYSMIQQRL